MRSVVLIHEDTPNLLDTWLIGDEHTLSVSTYIKWHKLWVCDGSPSTVWHMQSHSMNSSREYFSSFSDTRQGKGEGNNRVMISS